MTINSTSKKFYLKYFFAKMHEERKRWSSLKRLYPKIGKSGKRREKRRKIFANTKNEPYWPKTQFVRKDKNGIQQIKRLKD